jgi:hypothetical protein
MNPTFCGVTLIENRYHESQCYHVCIKEDEERKKKEVQIGSSRDYLVQNQQSPPTVLTALDLAIRTVLLVEHLSTTKIPNPTQSQ